MFLGANNPGTIWLSSNAVSGPGLGLAVSTQPAGTELAVSSLAFNALSSGATAIRFLGGELVSTFTAVAFADPGIAVNVDGARLGAQSRITMLAPTGARAGPSFENDPFGKVDWPDPPPEPIRIWVGAGISTMASEGANWDGGTPPVAGESVLFSTSSGKPCTWDLAAPISSITLAPGYSGDVQIASSTSFGDVHVSSGRLFLPYSSTVTVTGSFTVDGYGSIHWGTGRVRLLGNMHMASTRASANGNSILEWAGSAQQLFTGSLEALVPNLEITNSSEVYVNRSAVVYAIDVTISSGRLVLGGAGLLWADNWRQTGGRFIHPAGQVTIDGHPITYPPSTPLRVQTQPGSPFASLRIGAGPAFLGNVRLDSAIEVSGDVLLSSGTLDPGGFTHSVGKGWIEQAGFAFTPGSGSIRFEGPSTGTIQTQPPSIFSSIVVAKADTLKIAASLAAASLSIEAQGGTVEVQAGSTVAANTLTLGAAGSGMLRLRSSAAGTPWRLQVTSAASVLRTDVQDSNASPGIAIQAVSTTNVNSGNNTNWVFAPASRTWVGLGASANASEAANWSPAGVPSDGESFTFSGASTRTCYWDRPISIGTITLTTGFDGWAAVYFRSSATIAEVHASTGFLALASLGSTVTVTGNIEFTGQLTPIWDRAKIRLLGNLRYDTQSSANFTVSPTTATIELAGTSAQTIYGTGNPRARPTVWAAGAGTAVTGRGSGPPRATTSRWWSRARRQLLGSSRSCAELPVEPGRGHESGGGGEMPRGVSLQEMIRRVAPPARVIGDPERDPRAEEDEGRPKGTEVHAPRSEAQPQLESQDQRP